MQGKGRRRGTKSEEEKEIRIKEGYERVMEKGRKKGRMGKYKDVKEETKEKEM